MNLPKAPILKKKQLLDASYSDNTKTSFDEGLKAMATVQRDADRQFYQAEHDKLEKELVLEATCQLCKGQGWVLDLYQKKYDCPKCKGLGVVVLTKEELIQQGRREVVEWLVSRGILLLSHIEHGSPMEAKLKEWFGDKT